MSSRVPSTIFVIGGTGAQGLPVIRALVADGKYAVRALSRDPESRRAIELSTLGNVSIVKGTFADVDRSKVVTVCEVKMSLQRSTPTRNRKIAKKSWICVPRNKIVTARGVAKTGVNSP
ncbi:TPA: NmrA family NAD(P)-binding protein [Burkholderia cepacia]|uniref:NmrA family NAD(P)-binding protein n=1 Tax=Burkholderia cepacia TaxID=292 RepID=UPI0021AB6D5D|nr:NmrA family NAD(P)-binding protein [Burkholderia cepacia]